MLSLLALAALLGGALAYGNWRWNRDTELLHQRLQAARRPVLPQHVDFRELEGLPAPVQRYFQTVLKPGAPMVAAVHVKHRGTFNMGESEPQWKPFTSKQLVIAQRPGFDWNGKVEVFPGVHALVHDAYVAGEGILHVEVAGLATVADLRGTRAVAEGELMRFLAEAAWYPTALLPSQGVKWEAGDGRSARATLREGETEITLQFRFSEDGTIDSVRAASRGRTVGGRIVPTAWHGRFWNYRQHDGMLVPMDGEVAWELPEGPYPYWRGQITELAYEFASAGPAQPPTGAK